MRKKIVAANWKMNKDLQEGIHLVNQIKNELPILEEGQLVIIIPSHVHLASIGNVLGPILTLGAQNVHHEEAGAFTGEVSAKMLKSVGAEYALVGHSERRTYFKEEATDFQGKFNQLFSEGVKPIYCCGEQLEDRNSGVQFEVIAKQLEVLWPLNDKEIDQIVIAYEPVWAIGTGLTATAEQAQEMHAYIRALILDKFDEQIASDISILYGGSCNANNAQELFSKEDVDGGLIGGASLKSDDFLAIIKQLQ